MAIRKHERVSQRRYAVMLGVTNTAVANAVKDGRITKGWDKKLGKIIVGHADTEWGDAVRKIEKTEQPGDEDPVGEKMTKEVNDKTSMAEALRLKEIENARIRKIERLKMESVLVEKEKVNAELFELGKTLRKAFDNLPERIVDLVRAAPDRNAAILIIAEEKDKVLELLTRDE